MYLWRAVDHVQADRRLPRMITAPEFARLFAGGRWIRTSGSAYDTSAAQAVDFVRSRENLPVGWSGRGREQPPRPRRL